MITLNKARKAIEVAEAKAQELGISISTVVVDSSGCLICSSRMDGALSVSPKFAWTKAYTAGTLGLMTSQIAEYVGEGKPYNNVTDLGGGIFTTIAGGFPVKMGEKLIGGVGVGGSYDVSQDVACAEEAIKVLEE